MGEYGQRRHRPVAVTKSAPLQRNLVLMHCKIPFLVGKSASSGRHHPAWKQGISLGQTLLFCVVDLSICPLDIYADRVLVKG